MQLLDYSRDVLADLGVLVADHEVGDRVGCGRRCAGQRQGQASPEPPSSCLRHGFSLSHPAAGTR